MKTPEERKAAAAARQAKLQARIVAAKAKRRGALDDAKQATADTIEQARQARADALAEGQERVDAAKTKQGEMFERRDELKAELDEKLKTRNIFGFKRKHPRD